MCTVKSHSFYSNRRTNVLPTTCVLRLAHCLYSGATASSTSSSMSRFLSNAHFTNSPNSICPPPFSSMLSNSASISSIVSPVHFSTAAFTFSAQNSSLDTRLSSPVSMLKFSICWNINIWSMFQELNLCITHLIYPAIHNLPSKSLIIFEILTKSL